MRLQSTALVVGVLLSGVIGNWHVHPLLPHENNRPALDGLPTIPSEASSCVACLLGHHCSTEVHVATLAVVEVGVDRAVLAIDPVLDAGLADLYSSRAPPGIL